MKTAQRLTTNLVGRTVHLLTDDEAKDEARKQGSDPLIVDYVTAINWFPALKDHYQNLPSDDGRVSGEIVQVHLDKDSRPVYTIDFGGTLREMHASLWRLDK